MMVLKGFATIGGGFGGRNWGGEEEVWGEEEKELGAQCLPFLSPPIPSKDQNRGGFFPGPRGAPPVGGPGAPGFPGAPIFFFWAPKTLFFGEKKDNHFKMRSSWFKNQFFNNIHFSSGFFSLKENFKRGPPFF